MHTVKLVYNFGIHSNPKCEVLTADSDLQDYERALIFTHNLNNSKPGRVLISNLSPCHDLSVKEHGTPTMLR